MKQETGSQVKQKSPSQHHHAKGPKRPAKRRWVIPLIFLVLIAGVSALVASIKRDGGAGGTSGGTFAARRGDLIITVTEGGSIRAHKSIEYRCEVEARGAQTTILSIVPPGSYITQKDVDDGMVLVKMDSSALEEQLVREKMDLASNQESVTSAKESYDIQVIQNESDVADGRLRVRFALLDLQKYLGGPLALRLTRDANAVTDLTEHVAPFLAEVRNDPNMLDGSAAGQELKRFNDDIVLAEGNLKTSQARLAGTEKLHDANYVSDLDLQGDRLTVINRQFSEQNSKVSLDLFLRYDFPKNAEQRVSDYVEAGRRLERTHAECRSRLAQAQAKLANAQERFRAQQKRVNDLERQIANCTIHAKAPGLVIYGTGGSGDAFRAMRGRGGGGSGIIAEGEVVYQGQTLLSMPDTAAMVAEIGVHETEVDKVSPGQSATIVMDAFPDRVLHGRVLEVAPLPDQQRGWMNPDLKIYTTLVQIEGTHEFLRTRMSCKVEILVRRLNDVITVPIQVVANRQGKKVCYVATPQGPQVREVQTGAFNDTFVQVVSGLEAGEEVLLNPPLFTESGTASSFRDRPQDPGSDPADANNLPPAAPPGDAMGPAPAGAEMPGTIEMTDEMRQQMRQSRRQRGGPAAPGGDETAPEQRQPMTDGPPRQDGGPGGMPGGADMTPEQRQQMMERLRREVGEMTPEQRQQMMERFQRQGGRRGPRGGDNPAAGQPGQDAAPSGGSDGAEGTPRPARPAADPTN